jgi:hypothetical protein
MGYQAMDSQLAGWSVALVSVISTGSLAASAVKVSDSGARLYGEACSSE